jgi:hypothetical protein
VDNDRYNTFLGKANDYTMNGILQEAECSSSDTLARCPSCSPTIGLSYLQHIVFKYFRPFYQLLFHNHRTVFYSTRILMLQSPGQHIASTYRVGHANHDPLYPALLLYQSHMINRCNQLRNKETMTDPGMETNVLGSLAWTIALAWDP